MILKYKIIKIKIYKNEKTIKKKEKNFVSSCFHGFYCLDFS